MPFRRFAFILACMLCCFNSAQAGDFPRFEIFGGYSSFWSGMSTTPGSDSFQRYYFNESPLMFGDLNLALPLYHRLMNPPSLQHIKGFEVSGAYNITEWFGIEASYMRHSGEQVFDQSFQVFDYANRGRFITTISSTPLNVNQGFPITPTTSESRNTAKSVTKAAGFGTADLTRSTFLVGPRFSLRWHRRIIPFAHVQLGISKIERKNFSMKYSFNSDYKEYDAAGTYIAEQQTYAINGKFSGNVNDLGVVLSFGGGMDLNINKRISLRLIQADYVPTRNRFAYELKDDFESDISDYKYKTISVLQDTTEVGPIYADYNQETRLRVIYAGERKFQYAVPSQFMHNLKLSAGLVFKF